MDTKMKLPELRVGIDQQSLSLSYVIRASGLGGMNDKDALEVIARCNAAPKLVEALEKAERTLEGLCNMLDANDGLELPKDAFYAGRSMGRQAVIECRAILKETGAEK